ncbi:MAG: GIY-YIG nuclease family protein [Phaeodactylibacter sp.]|nr:GIY-YIG nuclease family protein [Phaeodactylibacter sp.]
MGTLARKRKWNFKKKHKTSFKNSRQRAWAKLLAILFDYGYIYLIKSDSKRGRYKIGISYDLDKRAQQVDDSIKRSREYPVFWVRMFFSEHYERLLHRRFKANNFRFTGSGKTEWFNLDNREVERARGWMKIYKAKQDATIFFPAVGAFYLAEFIKEAIHG